KGVVHLAQHGTQPALRVMTEPETDRVEDIAEQARKGLQHHFSEREIEALRPQLVAYPGQQRRAVTRTVVALMEGKNRAAIDPEEAAPAPARLQLRQRHPQKGDGI